MASEQSLSAKLSERKTEGGRKEGKEKEGGRGKGVRGRDGDRGVRGGREVRK